MKIWHNTGLVDQLTMPSVGSAWLLGDGAFETLRTYDSKTFELQRHIERLLQTLKFLQVSAPSASEIESAVKSVIDANPCTPFGRLRITVYGDGEWFVTHSEYQILDKPLSVNRYFRRRQSGAGLAGHKSSSYAENALALRTARAQGFDDSIFVNERDEVVESALANVIWLEGERWFTPPLASGCLPGITRALLIENFGVQEAVLPISTMESVQGLALTSSLREIVGIERYEGNLYPTSKELKQLQTSFSSWVLGKLAL